MGTRSLTVFKDEAGKEIVVMYRQMDGYPEGHGKDLADFLWPVHLVNGICLAETRKVANGMGCLAAQVVAHFKDGPGGFYLHPGGTRNCWEEYLYVVEPEGAPSDRIIMTVCEVDASYTNDDGHKTRRKERKLFRGDAAEFLVWVEERREKEQARNL